MDQSKYDYKELKWNNAKPLYSTSVTSIEETTQSDDGSARVTPSEDSEQEAEENILRIPLYAEKTALLIVDVQPEYWSSCPAVQQDFPDFEKNFGLTLKTARERKCKIIWVRADYTRESSPWLKQFERLSRTNKKRKDVKIELPCNPNDEEFGWEPFATPGKFALSHVIVLECRKKETVCLHFVLFIYWETLEGGEAIIAKNSWSSTSNTALFDILAAHSIDTVLVCGLITSVCVQHSAFGVFEAGYRTLLVEDSCGDRGRARHEAALALYGGYMYELITSKNLHNPDNGLQMAKPIWFSKASNGNIISNSSSASSLNEKSFAKRRKISIPE